MYIQDISHQINETNDRELLMKWYELLDELYFSREYKIIYLSDEDKRIICSNPECRLKLKIISFKDNIEIKNCDCLFDNSN